MYQDESGSLTGLDIALAREIAKKIDCPIRFIEIPFKRHLQELKNGKVDLASSTQYRPDRELFAHYSSPYRTAFTRLIIRAEDKPRFRFSSVEELKKQPFILGVTRGYYYGEAVKELLENPGRELQIEDVVADELNLKKLLAGRLDGFFADPLVVARLTPEPDQAERWTIHPMMVHTTTFHFIASQASVSVDQMSRIDSALQELMETGIVLRLMQEHVFPAALKLKLSSESMME